jgi:hypothetical protein
VRPIEIRPLAVVLQRNGSMVASAILQTREAVGFTLHVLNSVGKRQRSFASAPIPFREDLRAAFERYLTPDGTAGGFWSAHRTEYAFARCAPGGGACRLSSVPRHGGASSAPPSRGRTRRMRQVCRGSMSSV